MAENPSSIVIDEAYEFSAPQFFDFIDGETDEMARKAEIWFVSALSCAPSHSGSSNVTSTTEKYTTGTRISGISSGDNGSSCSNSDSALVASTETSRQEWKPHLTTPKCPVLHTLLRARGPKVKSSVELEQEELEKVPKFKARPLNKKIFESKGGLGIVRKTKKELTKTQEFHFSLSERIPPPAAVVDMFDKLSLNSEPRQDKPMPRNTKPNPFHLKTEERGAEKERKFVLEVMQKQWEDEMAKIPKASPYPYTTDFPVVSIYLVRHEEEMRREMEDRRKKEREEAQMRNFKAQPVLKE